MELDDSYNVLTDKVIGAAIEVHRHLGPGFLESIYEEALCVEFKIQNIAFERQVPICLNYKNYPIGEGRLDLLIDKRLVVELKTVDELIPVHTAQVLSYLKATKLPLGLLINFNVSVLREGVRRIVKTK